MSFKLSDVNFETDFAELIECQWIAHEDPLQTFYWLFCPIRESGRDASVKESTARMLEWHEHDPNARWLKVEDTAIGRINPFAHPEEEVTDWYPDDSSRDFVSQAIEQMDVPRMQMAARPQVFLNILFTHPDYRRKGIGSMLVQWGIDTAKSLGVEFWLNSTSVGKPLYDKFGFELVKKNTLVPKTENPDEMWQQTKEKFGEIIFWTMWLPKEGAIDPGNTVRPWETVGA
ncbi:hypothetical protein K458DRAFT_452810 [Lentithecium fluviatile CBS 122367]|uniref:N-acetyltransferase domain-containing protein n=1 Tax=Lentithecium fluviatile CBS 122367 TaxID=1168545 RepID=A0A6G1IYH8_9PLEO|nr:hypothetical protein K458DRAFT_452810 [Lentithecium fluviatile CBS 122367]